MTTPEGLDLLLAERAIRRVVARYARGIDRMDLEMVRDCYWPEAVDEHGTFSGARDEFISWVSTLRARHTMTMHKMGPPLIDWYDGVASVETYCVAYHSGEPAGDSRWNNVLVSVTSTGSSAARVSCGSLIELWWSSGSRPGSAMPR
jgi:hypothetical protein